MEMNKNNGNNIPSSYTQNHDIVYLFLWGDDADEGWWRSKAEEVMQNITLKVNNVKYIGQ